ncbi:MAG: phenylalanine--tRNA ligase subunit beta [Candidatus Thorarchaeota archaeon]|nr:phenylalanine--tRNA ligase subunit beta [Candidatus Thorarchaeota archaeon]
MKALQKLIGRTLSYDELEAALFLLKAEAQRKEDGSVEIEINPDRQDMLSTEGVARALRSFLEVSPGLRPFSVKKSNRSVIVGKGLEKIRRYIACGTVKGVQVDDELIREYMRLQEKLTDTHGRNRTKASIGLYVYDMIEFPVRYEVWKPEDIKFVPLGHEVTMDAPTILQVHDKGVTYGPIIAPHKKWPVLVDSANKILSLPPVINSNDLGRVNEETSNIFVEVTGTHHLTVQQALNIMVTSLAERGGEIESVTVHYPDGTVEETPDLKPKKTTIHVKDVITLTGLDMDAAGLIRCLHRMGYGAASSKSDAVTVQIPAYRTDILHKVDIIEDVAIGYGFDNIEPTFPTTMTTGKLRPVTRLKNKFRDLLIGVGYQEVLSYVMTSPETLGEKMLRDRPIVTTSNPKSRDYSVLRDSLLPVLLDFAAQNQHADFPQRIFEVGDVVVPDAEAETRTRQIQCVCALVTDSKVNLTAMLNEIGFILRNGGVPDDYAFEAAEDPSFISGRNGIIKTAGRTIGYFGEVHPEVLTRFSIARPVVAFELYLPHDGVW